MPLWDRYALESLKFSKETLREERKAYEAFINNNG